MIRVAAEADVPAILAIYAPYILRSTATFEYDVPTEAEFLRRFQDITARYPWLVWEENGEILGYAYASAPYTRAAFQWCAEPTVYLKPEAQGKGIAAVLYAALEKLLEIQGYQVLYALITVENSASVRFHKKQGYILRGDFPDCGFKFGRWLGLYWMEKRLKSVEIPRNAPVAWQAFKQDAQRISNILDNLSLS